MRTVVVTTLTISTDVAHQLRCLRAWKDMGCTVRVAAPACDIDQIDHAGWPLTETINITASDTGVDKTGQPAPRLIPLLDRIARLYPGQALVLATPGLYPALAGPAALTQWLEAAPALGLTAQEVGLLETARYSQKTPCRTQLDAFVVAPAHIPKIAQALAHCAPPHGLCFGDAIWDLCLGAVMMTPQIGGLLTDSGVLLREGGGHSAPVGDATRLMGIENTPETLALAQGCLDHLGPACTASSDLSDRIHAFHFAPPPVPSDLPLAATRCAATVQYLLPWVRWNYDLTTLAALAARIMGPTPIGADQILSVLTTGPNTSHQTSEAMLAMLIWALCRPQAAATLRPDFSATPALAQRHRETMLQLRAGFAGDLAGLRHALIRHIARDMIDHGVWSPPMRDATAQACQNDTDRLIFDTLSDCTRKAADAA